MPSQDKPKLVRTVETPTTIGKWADAEFGQIPGSTHAVLLSTLRRAEKEWAEANDQLRLMTDADLAEEIADVCIVLMRGLYASGFKDAIDKKMEINRSREWIPTGDGHGRHA